MRIVPLSDGLDEAVRAASAVIAAGGVIVYPTDTVYGIGCDATNAEAVARVRRMKQRESDTRFVMLVASFDAMMRLVRGIPPGAADAIRAIVPAPVTFVCDSSRDAEKNVVGCGSTIALRVPANDFCLRLCATFGAPLLSTSVNFHGEPVATSVLGVPPALREHIDLAVDGGELGAVSSTIVALRGGGFRILREGAVSREDLERKAGMRFE